MNKLFCAFVMLTIVTSANPQFADAQVFDKLKKKAAQKVDRKVKEKTDAAKAEADKKADAALGKAERGIVDTAKNSLKTDSAAGDQAQQTSRAAKASADIDVGSLVKTEWTVAGTRRFEAALRALVRGDIDAREIMEKFYGAPLPVPEGAVYDAGCSAAISANAFKLSVVFTFGMPMSTRWRVLLDSYKNGTAGTPAGRIPDPTEPADKKYESLKPFFKNLGFIVLVKPTNYEFMDGVNGEYRLVGGVQPYTDFGSEPTPNGMGATYGEAHSGGCRNSPNGLAIFYQLQGR